MRCKCSSIMCNHDVMQRSSLTDSLFVHVMLQFLAVNLRSSVTHGARTRHVPLRHTVLNTCSSFLATAVTYRQTPTDQ